MKIIFTAVFTLTLFFINHTAINAATVGQELNRVAGEVAELKLGFNEYVLGEKLSKEQKSNGMKYAIPKSLTGTYKFQDGEIFVIAAEESDIVLGMYKEYEDTDPEQLKKIIGTLMFEYGEPTATAHDKMIYWTYNSNGKISQDAFDFERPSGGAKSLVVIKFSSTDIIGQPSKESVDKAKTSAYLMITSDQLSTLFLAQTKEIEK